MQKIKNTIIKKCMEYRLTGKEIDFLLYISHFQDDSGRVSGIYYKDACRELDMSIQTFYDVKNSLVQKKIISVARHNNIDYDMLIEENDFTDKKYGAGYINTNSRVFYSQQFRRLKAAEKLMILDLMRLTYSNKGKFVITTSNFYKKYQDLFKVTGRVIRSYLSSIRKFFNVRLFQFKYIFIPTDIIKERSNMSDDKTLDKHIVETSCRRNRIIHPGSKELMDVAALLGQYRLNASKHGKNITDLVLKAIEGSLEVINRYCSPKDKYIRELRPALIHKLLRESLN